MDRRLHVAAGWLLGRLADDAHAAVDPSFSARTAVAPSSTAMCPSWSQECIEPGWVESYPTPRSSLMGSTSSSQRSPTVGFGRPRVKDATTPMAGGDIEADAARSRRTRWSRARRRGLGDAVQMVSPLDSVSLVPLRAGDIAVAVDTALQPEAVEGSPRRDRLHRRPYGRPLPTHAGTFAEEVRGVVHQNGRVQ